jgi:hypothetical protein
MAASSSAPPPGSPALCEQCGTLPAHNHICQIVCGRKTLLNLCDICRRDYAPTAAELGLPPLDGAHCFYCGDVALSVSLNQAWELPSRQQRYHYTCRRCAELYYKFLLEAAVSIPQGLSPAQKLQHIEQTIRETDRRVQNQVRPEAG